MTTTRAQRARIIRRRVIAGAVTLFVAAWLLITITLVSGHDPALARDRRVASVSSTTSTSTTAKQTAKAKSTATAATKATSTATPAAATTSTASSVTTRQS